MILWQARFDDIFAQVPTAQQTPVSEQYAAFSTLALFLYPHAIKGIFGPSSQRVIRRNASLLPAYTLILGLVALFGYMALAAGTQLTAYGAYGVDPASVMAIAASNLLTRNFYQEFVRQDIPPTEETTVSRVGSTIVLAGALIRFSLRQTTPLPCS